MTSLFCCSSWVLLLITVGVVQAADNCVDLTNVKESGQPLFTIEVKLHASGVDCKKQQTCECAEQGKNGEKPDESSSENQLDNGDGPKTTTMGGDGSATTPTAGDGQMTPPMPSPTAAPEPHMSSEPPPETNGSQDNGNGETPAEPASSTTPSPSEVPSTTMLPPSTNQSPSPSPENGPEPVPPPVPAPNPYSDPQLPEPEERSSTTVKPNSEVTPILELSTPQTNTTTPMDPPLSSNGANGEKEYEIGSQAKPDDTAVAQENGEFQAPPDGEEIAKFRGKRAAVIRKQQNKK